MRGSGLSLAAVCVVAAILTAGCSGPLLQKPTVTVDGIAITELTLATIDLELRLTVTNPNPVGATLTRVDFDLFFISDGEQRFLAHGAAENISIRPQGDTSVAIPVTVNNLRLIESVFTLINEGSLIMKVSGTATFDFDLTTFDVPFERTTEVALP